MKIELDLTQEELVMFDKMLKDSAVEFITIYRSVIHQKENALYEKIKQQISQQMELKKPE